MVRSASGEGRFGYVPAELMMVEMFGAIAVAEEPPMRGCAVLNSVAPFVVVMEVPPRLNREQQAASRANKPERAWDSGILRMMPYLSSAISWRVASESNPY